MRQVELIDSINRVGEMATLYGLFDLDINTGRPTVQWEGRNLHSYRLPFSLQSTWFPEFSLKRVQVNRRAAEALSRTFNEITGTWTLEALNAHGINKFVRCYAFGHKDPSLFWYGAGWELSTEVVGEVLNDVVQIFQRHGWTYCGLADKKRIREFEFW